MEVGNASATLKSSFCLYYSYENGSCNQFGEICKSRIKNLKQHLEFSYLPIFRLCLYFGDLTSLENQLEISDLNGKLIKPRFS